MKFCPVGADRQTDGHDDVNGRFSHCCERALKDCQSISEKGIRNDVSNSVLYPLVQTNRKVDSRVQYSTVKLSTAQ